MQRMFGLLERRPRVADADDVVGVQTGQQLVGPQPGGAEPVDDPHSG